MLRKSFLFAALMMALATVRSASGQILYDFVHDCSSAFTGYEEVIHETHGQQHCGNIISGEPESPLGVSPGHPETCTQEIKTPAGALVRGEWLACGPHGGPNNGPGCSYDFVQKCGGQTRSGGWVMPLNFDGSYPGCFYDGTHFTPTCEVREHQGEYRLLYCSCQGTTLYCNR